LSLKQCRFLGKFRGCVFFYTPCMHSSIFHAPRFSIYMCNWKGIQILTICLISKVSYFLIHPVHAGSKKNAIEIQQAVVHHKRGWTIQFLHRTKEQLCSFSMIIFLNRNDEKWTHTRQIKISARNHILPPCLSEATRKSIIAL
jgi:hypothetical protein